MKNPTFYSGISFPSICLSATLLSIPAICQGATLMVDINGGGNVDTAGGGGGTGPNLTGWTSFIPKGPTTYTNALGAGMNVTVAVAFTGDQRDRNRGTAITGTFASLSNMLTDFYGIRFPGNTATLTLTLPAGEYDFKSYHHDGENSSHTQGVTLSTLANANVTGVSNPSSSFTMTSGTAPTAIVTYNTKFTLTNAGNVSFRLLKDSGGNGEAGFNGFELTAIPEPSAVLLVALSLGTLGLRRRRAVS